MCARKDVDIKNIEMINNTIAKYPPILKKYIFSLERKTTYTKKVYAYYIINFMEFMNSELNMRFDQMDNYNDIKPMDIDCYMEFIKYNKDGKEKSATYRAAQLAAINGFFKYLKKNKIIDDNPCESVEVPKDNNEHEIITIDDNDLELMLSNIENGVGSHQAKKRQEKWILRDMAIVTLGITTGLRISAIVGIDLDDIDLERRCLKVTEKGNKTKVVYLGIKAAKALLDWINNRKWMVNEDERAVFINASGKRITTRSIERKFKQISKGTGKNITPHKMRATCATRLYEETGDIYLVQQQLGHKSIKNTQRYAKVSEGKKREAAEILDSLY